MSLVLSTTARPWSVDILAAYLYVCVREKPTGKMFRGHVLAQLVVRPLDVVLADIAEDLHDAGSLQPHTLVYPKALLDLLWRRRAMEDHSQDDAVFEGLGSALGLHYYCLLAPLKLAMTLIL